MMSSKTTEKRLTASVLAVILLSICLLVTTAALLFATVRLENNVFRTGKIAISLNGGNPIIREDEFLFEPGMTVVKEFTIENLTEQDAYYRLFFANVDGELADVLEVKITDSGAVLYEGTMSSLTYVRENPPQAADTVLTKAEGQRKLSMSFHFPEAADSSLCRTTLTFDVVAEATQAKNNPLREFPQD